MKRKILAASLLFFVFILAQSTLAIDQCNGDITPHFDGPVIMSVSAPPTTLDGRPIIFAGANSGGGTFNAIINYNGVTAAVPKGTSGNFNGIMVHVDDLVAFPAPVLHYEAQLSVVGICSTGPWEPCSEIEDGATITSSQKLCKKTYNLPNGISIGGNDITLDCSGATIKGTGNKTAIKVNGVNNAVIRSCNINSFQYGIEVSNTHNSQIENNSMQQMGINNYAIAILLEGGNDVLPALKGGVSCA